MGAAAYGGRGFKARARVSGQWAPPAVDSTTIRRHAKRPPPPPPPPRPRPRGQEQQLWCGGQPSTRGATVRPRDGAFLRFASIEGGGAAFPGPRRPCAKETERGGGGTACATPPSPASRPVYCGVTEGPVGVEEGLCALCSPRARCSARRRSVPVARAQGACGGIHPLRCP